MSYMALYRKWRPDEFDEVKGQEHIVTTLKNQIKNNMVGHAYLFCGTRGTGKTTIARLLAKAVNCENPQDGSPCNECESCKSISAGSSMNVIEIDAASNNGIDSMRQINSSVQYSPPSGKYLVYIIDEAHQITTQAFNALLKTIEEPPEYVIFIFATTESHKVPITILSRCQRYDFRRISIETIKDRLQNLMTREGIEVDEDALLYISKAADGSMRDALSILDRCVSFNLGNKLSYDDVLDIVGAVDLDVYFELFTAIKEFDAGKAVEVVDELIWQGKNLTQLLNEFSSFIRNVLMLKLSPSSDVDVASDKRQTFIELGNDISEDYMISMINIIQEAITRLPYVTSKRVIVETTIIKLCKPQMQEDFTALERRIDEIESKLDKAGLDKQIVYVQGYSELGENISVANNGPSSEEIVDNILHEIKDATPEGIEQIVGSWSQILKALVPGTEKAYKGSVAYPDETLGNIRVILSSKVTEIQRELAKNATKIISERLTNDLGMQVTVIINDGDETSTPDVQKKKSFNINAIKFNDIKIIK